MLDYRIITKEDYIKLILNNTRACSISSKTHEHIDKMWEKVCEGYNFIIAVGKEDEPMFYSINYFNEHVLQGKSNTNSNALTIKLNLDTTEFEEKLNRSEKQLQRVKELCDTIESINVFDKSLNDVKNIIINMVDGLK